MKKILISFAICAFLYIASVIYLFAEEGRWEDKTFGIDKELKSIVVDPHDPKVVYVGSTKAIFKTVDGGENWQRVIDIRGTEKAVNFLSIDPRNSRVIFAATENGLLRSKDEGKDWERIFEGIGELEKNCSSVAVSSRGIYLGTKVGLFQSIDEGKTWNKATGELGNTAIITLLVHPLKANIVYALTTKGVYKTDDTGKTWERIYVSFPQDVEDTDEQETDSEGIETSQTSNLRHLAIDSQQPQRLFLSFSEGLLMSPDEGKSWQKFPDVGLLNTDIQFILVPPQNSQLYAATKGGVFRFSKDRWQELFTGITSQEINFLALDSNDVLWAATENGLFKMNREKESPKRGIAQTKEILDYFKDEPTIQEIQQVAIRYAEVQPEKIESWRRGAKFRSILPKFKLGYDKSLSYSTSSTTAGTWWVGPRDWNVNFTWDLADLIWNPYQKDIDVRSRLMVQLRDDILDEVTRLYFERRRLQTEIFLSPPTETKTKLEKELRLQELTASIDALTGGYLSRSLSGRDRNVRTNLSS
jgi:hypothetical protein